MSIADNEATTNLIQFLRTHRPRTWNRWRVWGGTCLIVLTACTTPVATQPPLSQHDQVLDLIKRVMTAHESGLLADKEAAAKQLRLSFETYTDQFRLKRNRTLTGIEVLDGKVEQIGVADLPTVNYQTGVTVQGIPTYGFYLGPIHSYFCITQAEIEVAFGRQSNFVVPYSGVSHQTTSYLGAYEYEKYDKNGKKRAAFGYINQQRNACLQSFSVGQPAP